MSSDADRRAVSDCLLAARFSEASVCASLGIADFDALEGDGRLRIAAQFGARDLRAFLIRIFLLGVPVDAQEFEAVLAPHDASVFRRVGLIAFRKAPKVKSWQVYSPVRLVPMSDGSSRGRTLLIAADRGDTPDGSPFVPFADIVFSAHNALTRQFLRLLPTTPTGSTLELCSGTAVAALVAETSADRVVAVDVTERCTAFARFNHWLNGCERVQVRQGDLYDPVCGEHFDRILAHPPYVPALTERLIYRDAGELGDRLLRRIVAGLPSYLNRDGTFHMLSIGMDMCDMPFEKRVRDWLGDAESEFDIVFALGSAMTPQEFAKSLATKAPDSGPGNYERLMALFDARRVSAVVYGALVARRFQRGIGESFTRRVVAGPATGPDAFDRLLRWFDWLRPAGRRERVLASHPVLSADAQVDVHHVVEAGQFVPNSFRLLNERAPFRVQLETEGWIVRILNGFDGRRCAADVYEEAKRSAAVPEGFGDGDFVDLVCLLVERGLLVMA